jgi:L-ribulose-5-phosphate 4-epimerase
MSSQYRNLKLYCFEANMQLPKLGLVLFGFGNASVVDRAKGVFAIKPSGIPYDMLRLEDIVVVDFDNQIVEGDKRLLPSAKTHAQLFKQWESIGGIVHTHSTYATAWAQAQLDIPLLGTTHAAHLTTDVPCTPPLTNELIQSDYEQQIGLQIIQEFERRNLSPTEAEMILIGSHAPFTWGDTVEKAIYNSVVLEEIARLAYLSRTLRPEAPRLPDTLIRKHYEGKHS